MPFRSSAKLLNLLIAIAETVCLVAMVYRGNWGSLAMYTVLSNYLGLIASVVYLVRPSGVAARFLRYMATVCLTVTFLVVVCVFLPMYGRDGNLSEGVSAMLLKGNMPVHHLICPILSFVSFVFFEQGHLTLRDSLWAALPTLLYAIVTAILNILRVIEGPYPFLLVYEQPWYVSVMWFFLIPGGAWVVALLLKKCKNRVEKS